MKRTPLIWIFWTVATVSVGGIVVVIMIYGGPRGFLLIGQTTAGHYQIELACNACHTSIFGGAAAMQKACENCHLAELTLANDSHPKKKFTDPRNADRLEKLNVIQCVTCHREHRPGITHPMGVTIAMDYCFLCHKDLAKDRPTHKNIAFNTCASAGCHNFHDNRALYEDFLIAHHDEPEMLPVQVTSLKLKEVAAHKTEMTGHPGILPDAPAQFAKDQDILLKWSMSAHAKAGVNCSGCHTPKDTPPSEIAAVWVEKPGLDSCKSCHSDEVNTFFQGKHGMRLKPGMEVSSGGLFGHEVLTAMTPGQARLPMHADVANKPLNCVACHDGHDVNVVKAQTEACASCHADAHTKAYFSSPHYDLWKAELAGMLPPGSGVSCATCHMPRDEALSPDGSKHIFVTHNQNENLRPNEKMVRSVCMDCHGLGFVLDALADPKLVENNFNGNPSVHVQSIDWVEQGMRQRGELK